MRAALVVAGIAGLAALVGFSLLPGATGEAQRGRRPPPAPIRDEQSVLGPGLYVFQTRVISATCADAERTGNVSTFVAPVSGIPGAAEMRMELTNSRYWPEWTLTVSPNGHVRGEARGDASRGTAGFSNRFEVDRRGDRFTGTGARTYAASVGGARRECTVSYEALLRRLDV